MQPHHCVFILLQIDDGANEERKRQTTYNQTLIATISLVALVLALVITGAVLGDLPTELVEKALAAYSIISTLIIGPVYIMFLIIQSQGGPVDDFYYSMQGVTGRLLHILSDAYKLLKPRANEDDIVGYILPTIFLLVIGSIVSCFISMICNSGPLNITNNVFRIVLLLIQSFFFGIFVPKFKNRVRFNVKDWWNYLFGFFVASQICSWLFASFAPLMTNGNVKATPVNNSTSCPLITVFSLTSTNLTSRNNCDSKLLRMFDNFFKAFYVEFATVSAGVLLIIWNKIMFTNVDVHLVPVQANVENIKENSWIKYGVWIFALMVGFFSSIAIVVPIYTDYPRNKIPYFIYNGVQLGRNFILVVLASGMLIKLPSFTDVGYIPFSLSEYIVIFTSLFNIAWFAFRDISSFVCAVIDDTTRDVAILIVFWVTTAMVNTITQTYLIIAMRRKVTSLACKYLLVLFFCWNLANWIEDNFVAGASTMDGNPISPMVNALLGVHTTQVITTIGYPLYGLYRFQFTLIAFELYRKKHLFHL